MIGLVHEDISSKVKLMILIISLVVAILIVAGCSGDSTEKAPKKDLTQRQRDSLLSESGLPGAGVVGKAISVSDSASARAKRGDELAK